MVSTKWLGIAIFSALVVGLAGGYGIRAATVPGTAPTTSAFNPGSFRGASGSGRTAFAGFGTVGKIAAASGSTLQVQGSQQQVAVKVNSHTQIVRTVAGTKAALTVGACVTVVGPANAIGTITARRITVTPAGPQGCGKFPRP